MIFSMKEDVLFGRIAVLNEIITEEQLNEVQSLQNQTSPFRSIGRILLEKGYMNRAQVRAILQAQKRRLPRPVKSPEERKEDMAFAYLVVKHQYLNVEDVVKILKLQAEISKKGLLFRLWEILYTHGYLCLSEIREINEIQDRKILSCPGCDVRYNTVGLRPGVSFNCSKCGSKVTITANICSENEAEELMKFREDVESLAREKNQTSFFETTTKDDFIKVIPERFSISQHLVESKDEEMVVEEGLNFTRGMMESQDEFEEDFISIGRKTSTLEEILDSEEFEEDMIALGEGVKEILDETLIEEEMISIGPHLFAKEPPKEQLQSNSPCQKKQSAGQYQSVAPTEEKDEEFLEEEEFEEELFEEEIISIGPSTVNSPSPKKQEPTVEKYLGLDHNNKKEDQEEYIDLE